VRETSYSPVFSTRRWLRSTSPMSTPPSARRGSRLRR
jgi:hypothetical protein